MKIINAFSENLKMLREERKIGQVQLAEAIGVSKGVISLWENGHREPTLTSLIALANYFDISLNELVSSEA